MSYRGSTIRDDLVDDEFTLDLKDGWRSYIRRRQATHSVDLAVLEGHLREQVAGLIQAGLATDEAFLVAVKRMGHLCEPASSPSSLPHDRWSRDDREYSRRPSTTTRSRSSWRWPEGREP